MSDKRYYVYADSSIEADALALIHDYTEDINPLANPIKSDTIKWRVFLKKEGDIKHLDYDLEEIGAYLSPERIIEFESETGGACQFDLPRIQIMDKGYLDSNYNVGTSIIPSGGIFLTGVEVVCHYINTTDASSSLQAKVYVTTHDADGLLATITFNGPRKGVHSYCEMLAAVNYNETVEHYCSFQATKWFGASDYTTRKSIYVHQHDFIGVETDVWIDVVFNDDCAHEYFDIYMLYDTDAKLSCCKRYENKWEGI